jgi:hypothetical protein
MPDLSELLGDVYGEPEETIAATPASSDGPEWADDEHLDRAFAEWTPGPDADAPAAERSMFAPAPTAAPATRLADDLAAALSEAVLAESAPAPQPVLADEPDDRDEPDDEAVVAEHAVTETEVTAPVLTPAALAELEPTPEPTPEPAPYVAPVHKAGWQREDDDILPSGKGGHSRSMSLPSPKLPSMPKLSRGPKPAKAAKAGAPTAPKEKRARKGLKGLATMELSFGKKKK